MSQVPSKTSRTWLFVDEVPQNDLSLVQRRAIRRHVQPLQMKPGSRRYCRWEKTQKAGRDANDRPSPAPFAPPSSCLTSCSNIDALDPFDSLPVLATPFNNSLIERYATIDGPSGRAHSTFREMLRGQRQHRWLKVIVQDEAAANAFYAAATLASPARSTQHHITYATQCHVRALRLSAEKLRTRETACEDSLIPTLFFLIRFAAMTNDMEALLNHKAGTVALAAYRHAARTKGVAQELHVIDNVSSKTGSEFPGFVELGLMAERRFSFERMIWNPAYQSILRQDFFAAAFFCDQVGYECVLPGGLCTTDDGANVKLAVHLAYRTALAIAFGLDAQRAGFVVGVDLRMRQLHEFMARPLGSASWAEEVARSHARLVLWMSLIACLGDVIHKRQPAFLDIASSCCIRLHLSSHADVMGHIDAKFPWPSSFETETRIVLNGIFEVRCFANGLHGSLDGSAAA